jgi:D-alanine-D-alanine ligase
MKRLRVLVLMHEDLVPPDDVNGHDLKAVEWRTEYDVISTLKELGHHVYPLGVKSDLSVIHSETGHRL